LRSFTVEERRARLARRHFLSPGSQQDLIGMTGALIGWHATDPATPYLSLWSRLQGFDTVDLDAALYDKRSAVKHLAMRRTLWLVDAEHLPLLQAAASDRVADNEERRLILAVQNAGVATDGRRWFDAARSAVLDYLRTRSNASSTELRHDLPLLAGTYNPAPGKTYGRETSLAPRVLTVLAARGEIVRGPNEGGWTTSRPRWALADCWLQPVAEAWDDHRATAELTRRWLRAFGPASVEDVKWWFGSTLTTARRALAAADAVEVDLHGTPGYALPDDLESEPANEPWAALLPGLDVTAMGWFRRDWYLGSHREHVFDRTGNAGPTAWWNGRVVGGWCQDATGRVRLQELEDIGRGARQALQRRAAELTEWLDGVQVRPRFPSPLSKVGGVQG
jgi:hypothetical protein